MSLSHWLRIIQSCQIRDRITVEADALSPSLPASALAEARRVEARGNRKRLKAPDSFGFIRTARNWSDCQEGACDLFGFGGTGAGGRVKKLTQLPW